MVGVRNSWPIRFRNHERELVNKGKYDGSLLFFHLRYIWGCEWNEKIPKNIDKMTLIRVWMATAPLHVR
jgi:hypothetical protein